jgi:hydroxypyruvate reductase
MSPSPDLRGAARAIFEAALAAADPYSILTKGFRYAPGEGFGFEGAPFILPAPGPRGRVRIFGAGKAACSLARALEERLRDGELSGRLIVKHGHAIPLERVSVEEGGHPLPDEAGLSATKRLLADLEGGRPDDRILFVLTGGASALLVAPVEGVSLEDKIATTDLLLRSGATIRELNAVRKHLSEVKGGRLLERMAPARALAFVVSDVIGDDLSAIGSGPLVSDPTTFQDCHSILERYHLESRLPESVRERLRRGVQGLVPETPKAGEAILESAHHVIVASNRLSLDAARAKASALGFEAEIFAENLEGGVHEVASDFVETLVSRNARPRPKALLAGGELTLSVSGRGLGGRNQEFALVAARRLSGIPDVVVLSAGTDGTDGPTDAAGAFADGTTWERARKAGLDPEAVLRDNDSYRLFDRLSDLLRTGPTGTNVNDLMLGLSAR